MHIPFHRCLVTFGVLWHFTVLWVGLQPVIVAFPDHTHFLLTFFILIHIFFIKFQQKSGIGVIREDGGYYVIPRI